MKTEVAATLSEWQRDLRVRSLSPRTIRSYGDTAQALIAHCGATELEDLTRAAVRDYLDSVAATRARATVALHFRSLQQLFKWLEDEELLANPMAKMKRPRVPEQPVEVLTVAQVRAVLATCGTDFPGRRDEAIIRLLYDTGAWLSEVTQATLDDLDLDLDVLVVTGKGGRMRSCPFGDRTGKALARYLRLRRKKPGNALWISPRGPMLPNGVAQMLRRRGKQAGIDGLHAHQFRHTYAHTMRMNGTDDDALMRLAGWRSREMLNRYGASVADERARDRYRDLAPGEIL